jgi:hypothetical protein
MLKAYQDLRFLSHVQDSTVTAITNLPSWVPDYSVELRPAPLSMRNCNWKANGDLSWSLEPMSPYPSTLDVAGLFLDKVVDVIPETLDPHEVRETAATNPYWTSVFKLARGLNDTYQTIW